MELRRALGWCLGLACSLLLLLLPAPGRGHPQPCHILARIGHTVRLGALLPRSAGAQSRVRNALARASRAAAAALPYNLSLEVLPGAPRYRDPASLARWLCQALVVRGVAAVLAFPGTRQELLQLDFAAAFLEIPFISIVEQDEEDAEEPPMPFRTRVSPARASFLTCGASAARGSLPPFTRTAQEKQKGGARCSGEGGMIDRCTHELP